MNTKASPQSAGGQATGLKLRQAAVEAYEANPNICLSCLQPIPIQPGQKVAEVRIKKFCSRSCAAKVNNKQHPKRQAAVSEWQCATCKETFPVGKGASGQTLKRRYCEDCLAIFRANCRGVDLLEGRTKGELFENRKSWQSARSAISRHARLVLTQTKRPRICGVPCCGYTHHVDVCHRKPVADFPDGAQVREINDLSNLLFLCPNHHWEFDHGFLHL